MLQGKSIQKIVRFSFNHITESCGERRVQPNLYSSIYAHYFKKKKKKGTVHFRVYSMFGTLEQYLGVHVKTS